MEEKENEQKAIDKYINLLCENIEICHSEFNTLTVMLDKILYPPKEDNEATINKVLGHSPMANLLCEQNDKVSILIEKIRAIQQRLEI